MLKASCCESHREINRDDRRKCCCCSSKENLQLRSDSYARWQTSSENERTDRQLTKNKETFRSFFCFDYPGSACSQTSINPRVTRKQATERESERDSVTLCGVLAIPSDE